MLQNQLAAIEPSVLPSGAVVYPCLARLSGGGTRECVYFVELATFKLLFRGMAPESMTGLSWIRADQVISIEESPLRLPPRFANRIYGAGERWGAYSFTLIFSWWCRRKYLVIGFVDFLSYPQGRGPSDVKDVVLYKINEESTPGPKYHWCVFSRQNDS